MRRYFVWLGLLAVVAGAEEAKTPFRGSLRKATDEEKRISITVPIGWKDQETTPTMILRVSAASGGGHDIHVTREKGQSDIDALRDRYIEHDSAKFPGSTVKKVGEPYFGYRLDAPDQKQVVVRCFTADGSYGLILTITSRLANYDRFHAKKVAWVAASLTVDGERRGSDLGGSGVSGRPVRVWDKTGTLSLVAPAGWRAREDTGDDLLVIARGNQSGAPQIRVRKRERADSASLAITAVAREWKLTYAKARMERLPGDPPRLLVRGRDGDWVDYIIAAFDGQAGYTIRLVVREGSYDRVREVADAVAKTLTFEQGPWSDPTPPDMDLKKPYKKLLMVHATAEHASASDAVGKEFETFLKVWTKLAPVYDRKGAPLHVVLSSEKAFGERAHQFGAAPGAYDRQNRTVVLTTPGKETAAWRAGAYAAFGEALMHRDLKAHAPLWYQRGLLDCLRAAGEHGDPSAEIPGYVGRLTQRVGSKAPDGFAKVQRWTRPDFTGSKDLDVPAHAWGYTHLMLFGRGTAASAYKKWKKALARSRNKAPKFDAKAEAKAAEELQAHIVKTWGEE